MKLFNKWIWRIYVAVVTLFLIGQVLAFFIPDSVINFYYQTLSAFNPYFKIFYIFYILSIIFAVISLYPLYAYSYKINFLKGHLFWKVLLFARFVADLLGHNYEVQFLKSIYLDDPLYGGLFILTFLCSLYPIYFAHYHFAFAAPNTQE